MNPEALILRRCYPVPVTFADLRRAYFLPRIPWWERKPWTAALKEVTGAIDEVYAVVDGREVRVAIVNQKDRAWVADLLDAADRAGYWERPHEVRVELEERLISHDEVARAVMVGQQYVERKEVQS